jgi:hypothetical protein
MEKTAQHNHSNPFLKEERKGSISEHHKAYLGTDVPKDYFAKKKASLLEDLSKMEIPQKKKTPIFWLQSHFKYAVAASVTALVCLSIWVQNFNASTVSLENNFELFSNTEDVLINALFVEDEAINAYASYVLVNEILVKADASEENLENIFLNSLLVEDSLLDNYVDEEFVRNIIL